MLKGTTKTITYIKEPSERLKMLGRQVMLRRTALNLTREELGKRCGCSQYVIRDIEQGKQDVSVSRLFQLAEALDANISYFLSLIEIPSAGNEILIGYDHSYGGEVAELNGMRKGLQNCTELISRRSGILMDKEYEVLKTRRRKDRKNEILTYEKQLAD